MGNTLTIEIPEQLVKVESQNKSTFGHWRTYRRYRDKWLVALRNRLVPRHARPDCPMELRITSVRQRLLDDGNLVGGAKPIPDCLVRLGYIHDDSPKWLKVAYEQLTGPKHERRTIITITKPETGDNTP
jgi:hypothetical protein